MVRDIEGFTLDVEQLAGNIDDPAYIDNVLQRLKERQEQTGGADAADTSAEIAPDGAGKVETERRQKAAKFAPAGATVGVTASRIAFANADRVSLWVLNNGTATVYLGGDDSVTTAKGIPLQIGQAIFIDDLAGEVWAISGSAGQDVRVADNSP